MWASILYGILLLRKVSLSEIVAQEHVIITDMAQVSTKNEKYIVPLEFTHVDYEAINNLRPVYTSQGKSNRDKDLDTNEGDVIVGEIATVQNKWPNPFVPIGIARWRAVMYILSRVESPSYGSLLDATLEFMRHGKRRLHRNAVYLGLCRDGILGRLWSFVHGRTDNRVAAEIWWEGAPRQVKTAPYHRWDSPKITELVAGKLKYHFLWRRASSSWLWRRLTGAPKQDQYAVLIFTWPPERVQELVLPKAGHWMGEQEWIEYTQKFDIDDHYTSHAKFH